MQLNRRSFIATAIVGLGASSLPSMAAIAKPPSLVPSRLMDKALAAVTKHRADILHADIIAIADFGAASSKPRFHLVNLVSGHTTSMLVAHGKGSDPSHTGWLHSFSNAHGSNASSQGSFLTGQHYVGKHGQSRRLLGLDAANDLALDRAIVIHAASYVSDDMIKRHSKVGRSQGCFAVSEGRIRQVLDQLGPGRLLFADKS